MSEFVQVAVGVVVGADQRVLVAKRPPDAHQGNLWEFPGGKVESGETVKMALHRELREELGIGIDLDRCFPLRKIRHQYSDKSVLLHIWRVDRFEGEPHGLENQPVVWRSIDELQPDAFPAANRAIIETLKLPSVLAITGQCQNLGDFQHRLLQLLVSGIKLVQFRQPGLDNADFIRWGRSAMDLCEKHDARLLTNSSFEIFEHVNSHGLHVNSDRLQHLTHRPVPDSVLFSASCHTQAELSRAEQLGVDFALLSPVLPTASHPDARPLGWDEFKALAAEVSIPVYALGGMTPRDLQRSWLQGGHGIAAIGALWPDPAAAAPP